MTNRVREFRKEQHLTQRELSKKAGVGHSTISNIETGKYIPGVDVAIAVSKALGKNAEEVFLL